MEHLINKDAHLEVHGGVCVSANEIFSSIMKETAKLVELNDSSDNSEPDEAAKEPEISLKEVSHNFNGMMGFFHFICQT